jgi:hypothetical protein
MIFDPVLDWFRGKAVTIPPLDGAFRPNSVLDDATLLMSMRALDNIAVQNGRLLATSGTVLFAFSGSQEPDVLEEFEVDISALAISKDGKLAIALVTGRLIIDGKDIKLPPEIRCITALAFGDDGVLWLANGAGGLSPDQWVRDLMSKGNSGSVWAIEAGGQTAARIAGDLAYPYGLLPEGTSVVVSEAWRHRLVRLSPSGAMSVVADNLPGYPARLSPAAAGGAWLSVFAPRNRLIEFVLQEKRYREDMMASVPTEFWIAPSLASGTSFLEPLQCGGIMTMGVHKPWSPSRSYGLVVRLDADLQPLYSLHSRANGSRHGTTSAIEHEGNIVVASRGGGCLVSIDATGIR